MQLFKYIKTPASVMGLAFSPADPDLLATFEFVASEGQIHLWSLSSGETLRTIPRKYVAGGQEKLYFSPGGNYLIASVSDYNEDE